MRQLSHHGFDTITLLPQEDKHILPNDKDLLVFRRGKRGIPALARFVRAFLKARRSQKPDIYFFNSTLSLLALLALRIVRDRKPAVYCSHCWAASTVKSNTLKWRLVRAVEGRLCGLADVVVNVSKGDAELARRLKYRGQHVVVENAVPDCASDIPKTDLNRKHEDEVHLLFVGRFDRQKGLDILLAAFAKAYQKAPHLRLHLIGGAVRDENPPTLPSNVTLHGWLPPDELNSYYQAADALVVPSRWEGLPLVVPEALRCGTPVLVSNRSDMGDLIKPGETGEVFELDETALTRCLVDLKRNQLLKMRPAARKAYEQRFTLDRFGAEMAKNLMNLVN